ncbi:MAG: TlpA family protein disulfide reductase [Candidatus Scalindua sp.]
MKRIIGILVYKKSLILLGTIAVLLGFNIQLIHAQNNEKTPIAPEWVVSQWINSEPLKLSELKGKVVIVEFFQLWCPGCNRFSIPLMLDWEKKYQNNDDVQLISIHTVFEGHDYQTPERLKSFIKEKGVNHPVGVDQHVPGSHTPRTMQLYHTKGTPEMAVIDKDGRIRFQAFGSFDRKVAESLIAQLIQEIK